MKKITFFGFIIVIALLSCNDNANQGSNVSADSAVNNQSDTPSTGSTNTGASKTSSSTDTSFKQVMDKMMQNMHSTKMTNDPDHDFATMMKAHHEGAIEMSNIELTRGKNAELKQVAQKIIDDSKKDINDLNSFLNSHKPSKNTDFSKKQMDKMMQSMNMNMEHGRDIDKEFAMMMVMHHRHGIEMARDYLKVGTAEETRKVANNAIKANTEDIKKLEKHTGNMKGHSGH